MHPSAYICRTLLQLGRKNVTALRCLIIAILAVSNTSFAFSRSCERLFKVSEKIGLEDPRAVQKYLERRLIDPNKLKISMTPDNKNVEIKYEGQMFVTFNLEVESLRNSHVAHITIVNQEEVYRTANPKNIPEELQHMGLGTFSELLLARYLFVKYKMILISNSKAAYGSTREEQKMWEKYVLLGLAVKHFFHYSIKAEGLNNPKGWEEMDAIIVRSGRPWYRRLW